MPKIRASDKDLPVTHFFTRKQNGSILQFLNIFFPNKIFSEWKPYIYGEHFWEGFQVEIKKICY